MAGLGGSGGNTAVFFKGKFYLFLPLVWGNNWAQESRSKRKLQNSPSPLIPQWINIQNLIEALINQINIKYKLFSWFIF